MGDFGAFSMGSITAMLAMAAAVVFVTKPRERQAAYDKAIKDYKAGAATYTVTVTPDGADTTFIYKP